MSTSLWSQHNYTRISKAIKAEGSCDFMPQTGRLLVGKNSRNTGGPR